MATNPFLKLLKSSQSYEPTNPYDNGDIWSSKVESPSYAKYKNPFLQYKIKDEEILDPLEQPRSQMNYYTNKFKDAGLDIPEPEAIGKKESFGSKVFNKGLDVLQVMGTPINALAGSLTELIDTVGNKSKQDGFFQDVGDVLGAGINSGFSTLAAPFNSDLREGRKDLSDVFNSARESKNETISGLSSVIEKINPFYVGAKAFGKDEETSRKFSGTVTSMVLDMVLSAKLDIDGIGKALKVVNKAPMLDKIDDIVKNKDSMKVAQNVIKNFNKADVEKLAAKIAGTNEGENYYKTLKSLLDKNQDSVAKQAENLLKNVDKKLGGVGDFKGLTMGNKTLLSVDQLRKIGSTKHGKILANAVGGYLSPFGLGYSALSGNTAKWLSEGNAMANLFAGGQNQNFLKSAYKGLQEGNMYDTMSAIQGMKHTNMIRNVKNFVDSRVNKDAFELQEMLNKAGVNPTKVMDVIEEIGSPVKIIEEFKDKQLNINYIKEAAKVRDEEIKRLKKESWKLEKNIENLDTPDVQKQLAGLDNQIKTLEKEAQDEAFRLQELQRIESAKPKVSIEEPMQGTLPTEPSTKIDDVLKEAGKETKIIDGKSRTISNEEANDIIKRYEDFGINLPKGQIERIRGLRAYEANGSMIDDIDAEFKLLSSKEDYKVKSIARAESNMGRLTELLEKANKKPVIFNGVVNNFNEWNEGFATIEEALATRKLVNTKRHSVLKEINPEAVFEKGVSLNKLSPEEHEKLFYKFLKTWEEKGSPQMVDIINKNKKEIIDSFKYLDDNQIDTISRHSTIYSSKPLGKADVDNIFAKQTSQDITNYIEDRQLSGNEFAESTAREVEALEKNNKHYISDMEKKRQSWLGEAYETIDDKEYTGTKSENIEDEELAEFLGISDEYKKDIEKSKTHYTTKEEREMANIRKHLKTAKEADKKIAEGAKKESLTPSEKYSMLVRDVHDNTRKIYKDNKDLYHKINAVMETAKREAKADKEKASKILGKEAKVLYHADKITNHLSKLALHDKEIAELLDLYGQAGVYEKIAKELGKGDIWKLTKEGDFKEVNAMLREYIQKRAVDVTELRPYANAKDFENIKIFKKQPVLSKAQQAQAFAEALGLDADEILESGLLDDVNSKEFTPKYYDQKKGKYLPNTPPEKDSVLKKLITTKEEPEIPMHPKDRMEMPDYIARTKSLEKAEEEAKRASFKAEKAKQIKVKEQLAEEAKQRENLEVLLKDLNIKRSEADKKAEFFKIKQQEALNNKDQRTYEEYTRKLENAEGEAYRLSAQFDEAIKSKNEILTTEVKRKQYQNIIEHLNSVKGDYEAVQNKIVDVVEKTYDNEGLVQWAEAFAGDKLKDTGIEKYVDVMKVFEYEAKKFGVSELNEYEHKVYKFLTDHYKNMALNEDLVPPQDFAKFVGYLPHMMVKDLTEDANYIKFAKQIGFSVKEPFNIHHMERKLQGTITELNKLMKNEYGIENFFETNLLRQFVDRSLYSNNNVAKLNLNKMMKNVYEHGMLTPREFSELPIGQMEDVLKRFGLDVDNPPSNKLGIGTDVKFIDIKDKRANFADDINTRGVDIKGLDENNNPTVVPFSKRDTVKPMDKEMKNYYRDQYFEFFKEVKKGRHPKYMIARADIETDNKTYSILKDKFFERREYNPEVGAKHTEEMIELQKNGSDVYKELFKGQLFDGKNPPVYNALSEEVMGKEIEELVREGYTIVNREILEQYNEIIDRMANSKASEFDKFYDRTMNIFKAWAVTSPGFHLNNVVGNTFNSVLQVGMDIFSPKIQKEAYSLLKEFKKVGYDVTKLSGKLYGEDKANIMKEVINNGLLSGFFNTDIEAVKGLLDGSAENLKSKSALSKLFGKLNPLNTADNIITNKNKEFGEFLEQQGKLSNMLAHMKQGRSVYESVDLAQAALFDYSDLTDFEANAVKKYIAPFYTFAKKNFSYQAENLANNPKLFHAIEKFYRYTDRNFTTEKERMNRPDYISGGIKVGEGKYLDIDTPMHSFFKLFDPKELYSSGNPLLKAAIDVAYNKKSYTGTEISRSNNPMEKLKYFAESTMPFIGAAETVSGIASEDKAKKEKALRWLSGNRLKVYDSDKSERQTLYNYVTKLQNEWYDKAKNNPELAKLAKDNAAKRAEDKRKQSTSRSKKTTPIKALHEKQKRK